MISPGIHLANGPSDIERVIRTGAKSYVFLHQDLDVAIQLKKKQPDAHFICRLYSTNIIKESIRWLTGYIRDVVNSGVTHHFVLGNELNLPQETGGKQYDPKDLAQAIVEQAYRVYETINPNYSLHLPPFSPSPNLLDILQCLKSEIDRCPLRVFSEIDMHLYGSKSQMMDVVNTYKRVFKDDYPYNVTETNFGGGNEVNQVSYFRNEFIPLVTTLDELKFKSVHWFIWEWINPDMHLKTTLNIKDTPLENEMTNFYKRFTTSMSPNISLSVETATRLTGNYDQGPRSDTTGVVLHSTRGGAPSIQREYEATVNYFVAPGTQASSHFVVGPAHTTRIVDDDNIAWHASYLNATKLGIEVVQPTINDPFTDYQYRTVAEICTKWASKYSFPLTRTYDENQKGLIEHRDSKQGKSFGKSDIGDRWDWNIFNKYLNVSSPASVSTNTGGMGSTVQIGVGFTQYLKDHPELGLPFIAEFSDKVGNTYCWTINDKTKLVSVLVWRQFTNEITSATFTKKKP